MGIRSWLSFIPLIPSYPHISFLFSHLSTNENRFDVALYGYRFVFLQKTGASGRLSLRAVGDTHLLVSDAVVINCGAFPAPIDVDG